MTAPFEWHIITCEYPPQVGGVSDYTRLVAEGLASEGDQVHVWCPSNCAPESSTPGVTVHRALGKLNGQALRHFGNCLNQFPPPRRLLVQWVPHGYGYRSMNLPFCLWLWTRAKFLKDDVQIMVHEPFLAFGEGSWKQDAAAVIHRMMSMILLNAATRVWISIPAWGDLLRPFLLGRRVPLEWLPVPSSVGCALKVADTAENPGIGNSGVRYTLGHFGTFSWPIVKMLEPLISPLLKGYPNRSLILMGRGSTEFRRKVIDQTSCLNDQIFATGEISAAELSAWISKCDLMIQPYPDGVSSRRTTAMAALSHGLPIVTTVGPLTEPVWEQSGAAALVQSSGSTQLLNAVTDLLEDEQRRSGMGLSAKQFYLDYFDVQHTINALRSGCKPHPVLCES
jgi:glycosyltransferase involved in cell wall biosynthesis